MELLCSRMLLTMSCFMTHILCSPAAWDNNNQQQQQQLGAMSPTDWGLRANEDLPIPDLVETPNKLHDPRAQDLNTTFLLQKLGRHFDRHFMSVTNPRPHQNHSGAAFELPFRRNNKGRLIPLDAMPEHLRRINYKFIRLPDGSRMRTLISPKLKKKLQQFLWAYTSCPVVFRWRDLGVRFWPRYLKEGSCPPGKVSCSIPPGMSCQPTAKGHKTVLRYNCRSPHRNYMYSTQVTHAQEVPVCSWIEVRYPIVSKCGCACPSA